MHLGGHVFGWAGFSAQQSVPGRELGKGKGHRALTSVRGVYVSDIPPATWGLSLISESMLQGSELEALEPQLWNLVSSVLGWLDGGFRHHRSQESKGSSSLLSCLLQPLRGYEKAEQARREAPICLLNRSSMASVLSGRGGLPSPAENHPSLSCPSGEAYNCLFPGSLPPKCKQGWF